MKLGYAFADAYLMAKEKSTPFTKEHHQPAEKVVSTPPPHLSLMCPTEGIFCYQKFIKSLSQTFLFAVGFFVMLSAEKEAIFLTIEEYIKSKPKFELMPFVTIYTAICELINDGFIEHNAFGKGGGENVAVCEQKPKKQVCWGLYSQGDFVSNR